MSQYDGLNLPQLMELMHDVVVPEQVGWGPATAGWWILLGWLLGVGFLFARQWINERRRNRYRREALAELATIEKQLHPGGQASARDIAVLIKRTALVAYPREQVASLYGEQWASFLQQSTNDDRQIAQAASDLGCAAWRPDIDAMALCEPARRWIRLHRV